MRPILAKNVSLQEMAFDEATTTDYPTKLGPDMVQTAVPLQRRLTKISTPRRMSTRRGPAKGEPRRATFFLGLNLCEHSL